MDHTWLGEKMPKKFPLSSPRKNSMINLKMEYEPKYTINVYLNLNTKISTNNNAVNKKRNPLSINWVGITGSGKNGNLTPIQLSVGLP